MNNPDLVAFVSQCLADHKTNAEVLHEISNHGAVYSLSWLQAFKRNHKLNDLRSTKPSASDASGEWIEVARQMVREGLSHEKILYHLKGKGFKM
ncbi:hypothetical protein HDU98_003582, partial [Podochytrium sp. JEL0797]